MLLQSLNYTVGCCPVIWHLLSMLQSLIVHSLTLEGKKTDCYVSFKDVGFDFGSVSFTRGRNYGDTASPSQTGQQANAWQDPATRVSGGSPRHSFNFTHESLNLWMRQGCGVCMFSNLSVTALSLTTQGCVRRGTELHSSCRREPVPQYLAVPATHMWNLSLA